ncbi:unnamed protein product [Brassica rapa subsp. narinosa]
MVRNGSHWVRMLLLGLDQWVVVMVCLVFEVVHIESASSVHFYNTFCGRAKILSSW